MSVDSTPNRDWYQCPHCREKTTKRPIGMWRCPSCGARVFPDEVVELGSGF